MVGACQPEQGSPGFVRARRHYYYYYYYPRKGKVARFPDWSKRPRVVVGYTKYCVAAIFFIVFSCFVNFRFPYLQRRDFVFFPYSRQAQTLPHMKLYVRTDFFLSLVLSWDV